MNTDSQGRPLSEDGQWVWNGTEWIPTAGAANGAPAANASAQNGGSSTAATMIAPPPLVGGPVAPQQGYGAPTAAAGFGPGANTPAFGTGSPYGGPTGPQKSRKPLVLGLVGGVLIIAGVVVALVLTLGGDKKTAATKPVPAPTQGPVTPHNSPAPQPTPQPTDQPSTDPLSEGPAGAYTCSVKGSTDTGTITFDNGAYTLSDGGQPGHYTLDGDILQFDGGSLAASDARYDSSADEVSIDFQGSTLTCTA